jgi:hypothetical protein
VFLVSVAFRLATAALDFVDLHRRIYQFACFGRLAQLSSPTPKTLHLFEMRSSVILLPLPELSALPRAAEGARFNNEELLMDSVNPKAVGWKHKVIHEVRRLVLIFLYLALFFLVFRFYTRLVLSEYQIDFSEYGLTLLKALVLAKIILTAEALRFGERFREQPLIVPTLYSTVVFCAFALVFEICEHLVVGLFHGKSPSEVFAELTDKGWPHVGGMILVVFVAFLPFFAFREAERALGEGKLKELFINRRVPNR